MASTFPKLPIFQAIASHDPHSTAVIHSKSSRSFTYGELLSDVEGAKIKLYHRLRDAARQDEPIGGQRVAFIVENGYDYVVTLLSIFACDGIAVPLTSSYPLSELQYITENSQPLTLLASHMFEEQAEKILSSVSGPKPTLNIIEKIMEGGPHDDVQLIQLPVTKGGLMLYTSGTTSRPKGVVLNTSTLTAQASSLLKAWEYTSKDHILHILPLHHIHGTVNALLTPLFAGSTIEFLFPFNPTFVWERLASPFLSQDTTKKLQPQQPPSTNTTTFTTSQIVSLDQPRQKPITFLSAVPTIYTRLLSTFPSLPPPTQVAAKTSLHPSNLRLNISGSAALPTPTKSSWTDLSGGNVLLERYGMTEVGMALSCGLPFSERVDGSVGWPLPDVEVRLVDAESGVVIPEDSEEKEGEIQLRGATVFEEYWGNEEATREEFVEDGDTKSVDLSDEGRREGGGRKWFKTGDIAVRRVVPGLEAKGPAYFILGRKSTDIIKTGGEKVSALEVERELLALPQIHEAAVIGLPSERWGQKVCAVVVLEAEGAELQSDKGGKEGKAWGVMDMRRALKNRLAAHKIPQEMRVVEELGRNAMGKVNKKDLLKRVEEEMTQKD